MRLVWFLLLFPSFVAAEVNLPLPVGAVETERAQTTGQFALPIAQFTPDVQPSKMLGGDILTRSWRTPLEQSDTQSVTSALRDEVLKQGFSILFECESATCGGFDFRFNVHVLPQPAMEVDLQDFYHISAISNDAANTHLAILISKSETAGHIQITEITEAELTRLPLVVPEVQVDATTSEDLISSLEKNGRAVLEGVSFASGSTVLEQNSEAAIIGLAELLEDHQEIELLIVGHSDNQGSLEANIRLSNARAEAVRKKLISDLGIAPERLEAWGAGYIAPRAPNNNEQNRALNRRVEIVTK